MSQASYTIDNLAGAGFRAAINDALAAIVTNNSGATEPATMHAHQWWADTSASILKRRNAGNTAWISVMSLNLAISEFSETILAASDAAAARSVIGALSVSGGNLSGAFNEKRSTVALAATTSPIWTGGVGKIIDGTGTPTITDFPAAPQTGAQREVHPAVGTIITNAGNIAVQGSANYTFAAGDYMIVTAITTTTFRASIFKGNGQAITATPDSTAVKLTGDQSIAGSKTFANSIVAPNAAKAWANINGVGAAVFRSSNGFSSLTDNGTGDYACNFSVAQPNTDYAVLTGLDVTSSSAANYGYGVQAPVRTTTSVRLQVQYYNNATGVDAVMVSVAILGN